MANWLIAVDDNDERRESCIARVAADIAPFDGLESGTVQGRGWGVTWAAGSRAPVDAKFGEGGGAVIWGEPWDRNGALRDAANFCDAWRAGATQQWDGFFAAMVVDEQARSVIVGTDLLGIFPVYHWTNDDGVSLIGTSPNLFRGHEAFRAELDLEGLIGILLTNSVLDNRALWKGVRRLVPGNRVRVTNGALSEDVNYRVPVDIETVDIPHRGHVKRLEASFRDAMDRHVPGSGDIGFMLSGGLDSRLLAGFLGVGNSRVRCLTFGRANDYEMRSAKAVAKAMRFRHESSEVPVDVYPAAASRLCKWEVLGAGFSGVPEWGMQDILMSGPDRTIVGHAFDGIAGGIHIGWAYDSERRHMGLDVLLPTIHAWGLEPGPLKKLVGPELAPAVDVAMERIHSIYNDLAPREHHRAWVFDLQHRQRLHVGSALWPISFATWPVAPFLDRDIHRVCAEMPSSSLAERRAQFSVLREYFPELAAQPLDRNSSDDMPPSPRLKHFLRRSLNYRIHPMQRSLRKMLGKEMPERVYYRRLYDFNAPGWRLVREMAEPYRDEVKRILVPTEVDAILASPGQTVDYDNPVKDSSAARLLMGLGMTARYLGTR